ncbi:hypothetical protein COCVIDRAFT_20270 [Bipolaris victoriae FI3]|uniref:Uncharacterized protein n=1 Tax=Bipolaris victoriae (strain FI3) TaxID=930091 RepID=W7ECL9_BIPV3|nr:hypothetical protein COCVIDRAFT_20270 [Bipolaris victoriae FI3]
MPTTWTPEKTLQDFIKDNSHSRQIEQERYQGRVFNDKGHVIKRITRNNHHDIHEIEGSLEVQRQLLLKLAERENKRIENPKTVVKMIWNTSVSRLATKLEVLEKGTLGSVGLERFWVEFVPLFHIGKGKRRDGLVGNRKPCEPIAQVLPPLVTLFVTLLSRQWDDALEKPRSTRK